MTKLKGPFWGKVNEACKTLRERETNEACSKEKLHFIIFIDFIIVIGGTLIATAVMWGYELTK